jgi:hypothetical protein
MVIGQSIEKAGSPYGSRTRLSRLKKVRVLSGANELGSVEVQNRFKRYQ